MCIFRSPSRLVHRGGQAKQASSVFLLRASSYPAKAYYESGNAAMIHMILNAQFYTLCTALSHLGR